MEDTSRSWGTSWTHTLPPFSCPKGTTSQTLRRAGSIHVSRVSFVEQGGEEREKIEGKREKKHQNRAGPAPGASNPGWGAPALWVPLAAGPGTGPRPGWPVFSSSAAATRPLLFVCKLITSSRPAPERVYHPPGGGRGGPGRQRGVRTFPLLIPRRRGLPAEYEPPGASLGGQS